MKREKKPMGVSNRDEIMHAIKVNANTFRCSLYALLQVKCIHSVLLMQK